MPTVQLPRPFTLRFDDGRIVEFPGPGRYNVDAEIAGHSFMRRLVVDDLPLRAGAPPLSASLQRQDIGHLPTPAAKPQELAPAEVPLTAIPVDWADQHHMTRMALAKRLAPDQPVDNVTQADAIIAAEVDRRGNPRSVPLTEAERNQLVSLSKLNRPLTVAEKATYDTLVARDLPEGDTLAALPLTEPERIKLAELRTVGRPMTAADQVQLDGLAARENLPPIAV